MDRLTKWAHFIPFRVDQSIDVLTKRFIQEVVRIVSYKDIRFRSHYRESLINRLKRHLDLFSAYYP